MRKIRNVRSKFNDEQVIEIIHLHGLYSVASIAKYFKVAPSTISCIGRGYVYIDIHQRHWTTANLSKKHRKPLPKDYSYEY